MEDLALPIFILLLCGCASSSNEYLASDWQHMTTESTQSFMGINWTSNRYLDFSNSVRCGIGKDC